jgi:hypothetical protein
METGEERHIHSQNITARNQHVEQQFYVGQTTSICKRTSSMQQLNTDPNMEKKKVKSYPRNRPWRPIGL